MIHKLYIGNVLDVLPKIQAESIDLEITSPPYWGLRDYGIKPFDCKIHKDKCIIGLEPQINEYIDHIVAVFNGVKRILKKTGSLYINMGDTYASKNNWFTAPPRPNDGPRASEVRKTIPLNHNNNLPSKCLNLMPSRIALALIDDGWILRNDIIWHKPNGMPYSGKDRLTSSYEHIFHFVKSQKYYYDLDKIRIPHKYGKPAKFNVRVRDMKKGRVKGPQWKATSKEIENYNEKEMMESVKENYNDKFQGMNEQVENFGSPRARTQRKRNKTLIDPNAKGLRQAPEPGEEGAFHPLGKNPGDVIEFSPEVRPKEKLGSISRHSKEEHPSNNTERWYSEKGKNPGDFWNITTQKYPEAHFAVYPEEICKRPILSSCPPGGVVLDPFSGSGTTGKVARDLGRNSICIDINPSYEIFWRKRLRTNESLDIKYIVERL